MEQLNYRFKKSVPQSIVSDTLPNQTVDLRVLVRQLMNGESLNVGLSLSSTKDATFDDVDLSKLDLAHMTVEDVDSLMPKAPVDPVVVPDPEPRPPTTE